MSLPPLPIGEAEVLWFDPVTRIMPERAGKIIDASMAFMDSAALGAKLYSADQMLAYGQQCRDAALLEAAKVCSEIEDDDGPALECTEAIFALIGKKEEA